MPNCFDKVGQIIITLVGQLDLHEETKTTTNLNVFMIISDLHVKLIISGGSGLLEGCHMFRARKCSYSHTHAIFDNVQT